MPSSREACWNMRELCVTQTQIHPLTLQLAVMSATVLWEVGLVVGRMSLVVIHEDFVLLCKLCNGERLLDNNSGSVAMGLLVGRDL